MAACICKARFRGCARPQGGAVSLTAYMVPCVRFRPFVRFVSRLSSYGSATLGTGGWLDLTRQGLAPCKKRQACLGAHAPEAHRRTTHASALAVRWSVGLGLLISVYLCTQLEHTSPVRSNCVSYRYHLCPSPLPMHRLLRLSEMIHSSTPVSPADLSSP